MKNIFLVVLLVGMLFLSNKIFAVSSEGDSLKHSLKNKPDIIFGFFPNSAKDKIFVETNYLQEPCKIYITDVVGNLVMEKTCEKKKNEISLEELNSGIYYLTITQAEKSINKRLIIEK